MLIKLIVKAKKLRLPIVSVVQQMKHGILRQLTILQNLKLQLLVT